MKYEIFLSHLASIFEHIFTMNRKRAVTRRLPPKVAFITYARNCLGPVLQKLLYFYSRTFPSRLVPRSIILTTGPATILLLNFAALSKPTMKQKEEVQKQWERSRGKRREKQMERRADNIRYEKTVYWRNYSQTAKLPPKNISLASTTFLNAFGELRIRTVCLRRALCRRNHGKSVGEWPC